MQFFQLHRYCAPVVALLMLFTAACTTANPAPSQPVSPAIVESTPSAEVSQPKTTNPVVSPQVEVTEPPMSSPMPEATEKVIPPTAAFLPEGPQLAFLKDGDIWLLDSPEGQPYQLTFAGDLVSFAWSSDGERLAAFNGKALCFFQRDGSIRTACLELGLDDEQSNISRNIVWSPQQNWIVLWNPNNPWDENAIGWLVLALDTTNAMWRIQDPVDWGATLAPDNESGGMTGQPLFLPDGRLIGTLTHRYLCASGGCRYQLFEFDLHSLSPSFTAFPNRPEEGWSEGANLLLSPDGATLTNYGAFLFACDTFHTYIDRYDLAAGERETFALDQQVVVALDFSPDQSSAILARTAGCSEPEQTAWNQSCGLSQGFETLPMQLWQLEADKRTDLPAGLNPAWSPDGDWIVFNSCLKKKSSGEWETDAAGSASIYLAHPNGAVTLVSEGSAPAWRPR